MLGDILRLQQKYGEAKDVFTHAKQEFLENGDPIGSIFDALGRWATFFTIPGMIKVPLT
jgi:hypothetical protein